ncbi:hypothetical protein HK099_002635 [Clydaea vesicula]|uniref:Zn(2)-C6 fungal-type domain-containing protein n=1 Tax=Clydaea vesicula TaxID=447962 RepID=A0AAD5TV40_9FUNG|nr:hypothetical protein HK099_002635 [Clydaea vesicula]
MSPNELLPPPIHFPTPAPTRGSSPHSHSNHQNQLFMADSYMHNLNPANNQTPELSPNAYYYHYPYYSEESMAENSNNESNKFFSEQQPRPQAQPQKRRYVKRMAAASSLEPIDTSVNISEIDERKRRTQVKVACIHCKKACKKCDDVRPCTRCVRIGFGNSCSDAPRKERKKGFKRGPYNKQARRDSIDSSISVGVDSNFGEEDLLSPMPQQPDLDSSTNGNSDLYSKSFDQQSYLERKISIERQGSMTQEPTPLEQCPELAKNNNASFQQHHDNYIHHTRMEQDVATGPRSPFIHDYPFSSGATMTLPYPAQYIQENLDEQHYNHRYNNQYYEDMSNSPLSASLHGGSYFFPPSQHPLHLEPSNAAHQFISPQSIFPSRSGSQ